MGNIRRAIALSAAVSVSLLLASCIAPATQPRSSEPSAASPSPAATSSPTASAEPLADAPQNRLGVTCDDLSSADAVTALTGIASDSLDTKATAERNEPRWSAIGQLGGLTCAWGTGFASVGNRGYVDGDSGLTVSIAPATADQWQKYQDYYGANGSAPWGDDSLLSCPDESGMSHTCTFAAYVNGSMLDGIVVVPYADAGLPTADFTSGTLSTVTTMVDAVAAAPVPGVQWTPATPSLLPGDCAGLLDAATLSQTLGSSETVGITVPGGGWSLQAAAEQSAGTLTCILSPASSDSSYGIVMAAPGGVWAWQDVRDTQIDAGSAPVAVAGVGADGEAYQRCWTGAYSLEQCAVDVIVGGDWVQVIVYGNPSDGSIIDDPAAASLELAVQVVDRLTD